MQDFVLRLMAEHRVILIRGNHEDLFETFVTGDEGKAYSHHVHNGTFDTALRLTGFERVAAKIRHRSFAAAAPLAAQPQACYNAKRTLFRQVCQT